MAHDVTDQRRAEVRALASFGSREPDIAEYLGISPNTLRKLYREELDHGHEHRNGDVREFLFHAASGRALQDGAKYRDCLTAAIFWAKTRMRWRETNHIDHTSSDGSMSPPKTLEDFYGGAGASDDTEADT